MAQVTTRVAIIGAGPAGLLLGIALHRAGIDFVILENRSREYVLGRVRAGVLEQGSVETLTRLGVGDRLARDGLVHDGIYLQFAGERHHVDFTALIGRTVTVYGQQEVVKDLMAEHDRLGSDVRYEVADVAPHGLDGSAPTVTFTSDGRLHELAADFVVGADGFHGVSRASIPADQITIYEREYPYAWLGILANVAPSTDELIYCLHEDGFAMHSMRSHSVSRLYLQVDPTESIDAWSDARIWDALHTRLGVPGWTLHEGEITEKSITPMRSFVASRLDYGRLFLVGDAGHIVPPTGAKGLNSALSDVTMLAAALIDFFAGDERKLAEYGTAALARQWRTQQFSQWMTEMLHRRPGDNAATAFDYRSQLGELSYVTGSDYAMQMLAEQYTGLKL
ncbi:MAG: 4-hydroxybenzoate 3-monooxygenase [Glaciihabitans sp.]|nr:4-hydroxybenzoate 3-monooxygenase [Glaciihabitans sp.]